MRLTEIIHREHVHASEKVAFETLNGGEKATIPLILSEFTSLPSHQLSHLTDFLRPGIRLTLRYTYIGLRAARETGGNDASSS
jgi:hypothetical protein